MARRRDTATPAFLYDVLTFRKEAGAATCIQAHFGGLLHRISGLLEPAKDDLRQKN